MKKTLIFIISTLFTVKLLAQNNQVVEEQEEFNLSDHCRFEGRKWRGQRELAGSCVENKEVNVGCIESSNSATPYQNKMQTCECLMRNMDFFQRSREAFNFKMMRSQEAREYTEQHGFIAKKERTKEMYRDLCYPSKAIEIVGECSDGVCDKYYAVYMYRENNSGTDPECILIRTSHNWPHVFQQKFYFPGSMNITKLFQSQIDLNISIEGYNGLFNRDYFDRSDSIDGDLNCYGSLSEVVEDAEQAAQEALEQGVIIDQDRGLATESEQDLSPSNSANSQSEDNSQTSGGESSRN